MRQQGGAAVAIGEREAIGGIAVGPTGVTIQTAAGAGAPYSALLKGMGAQLTQTGQHVTYTELAPLPSGDPAGTGLYCHGDSPTMADCCLVPQVFNAQRFAIDLAPYPRVARIHAHCAGLPACAAAHPSQQPDAE